MHATHAHVSPPFHSLPLRTLGHLTPLPDLVPDSNRNRNNQSVSQSISYLLTTVDSRLKQHNVTRVTRASETTHLQRTRMVFNCRRGHLKSQHENPWRLGDPLGELTPLPRSGSRPSPKAPPGRSQSALRARYNRARTTSPVKQRQNNFIDSH